VDKPRRRDAIGIIVTRSSRYFWRPRVAAIGATQPLTTGLAKVGYPPLLSRSVSGELFVLNYQV